MVSIKKTEITLISGSSLWFTGWLFTLGYAGLSFWQGMAGIVAWPYYLGLALAPTGVSP